MKIKEIIPYILVGFMVFTLVQQHCSMKSMEKEIEALENFTPKPYRLPDDVVTLARLDDHIMKIVSRVGGDSVYVTTTYIPLESEVITTVSLNETAIEELQQAQILLSQLEQQIETAADSATVDSLRVVVINLQRMLYTTEIEYDTHGFCSEPEVGAGVDSDLRINLEAGARIYYINRFGIGLHGAVAIPADSTQKWEGSLGLFGDYRIPGWENTAIFGSIDYKFAEERVNAIAGIHFYPK